MEETKEKINLTGLTGIDRELALFSNSDIIIRAESKEDAMDIIDIEFLETKRV